MNEHMPIVHDQLVQGVSLGQSPLFWHVIPPLELLELLLDEDEDEDDDATLDEEAPPPPAVPLDELEFASDPALPPVAAGSN